jgi:lycopene cyclase domain-containing protein
MCPRLHGRDPGPRLSAWIVVAMFAMVAVPAALTLYSVHSPAGMQVSAPNPTPYGYTWSLLLFIIPIVVIGFWFLPAEGVEIPRQAFWRTIAILVPLGFGLDFFFARWFFIFPNSGATLGIKAPALGHPVPVEEYIFYFTGFLCVLLIYLWLDEFWLAAYNVPDYANESKKISRLFQFHPTSAIVGVALIVAALVYKKMFSPVPEGFPSYFTFLVLGAFVPAMSFFPTARPFINWRAFSLTLFIIVLVSLLWEATLAVPYQWWGFQPKQMTGLFIGAWASLPIEEVCLWIAVSYSTVIVFETFKLWQASGKQAKHAFLGKQ